MWSWWSILAVLAVTMVAPVATQAFEAEQATCDSLQHTDELLLPSGPTGPATLPEERLTNRITVWIHGPTETVNYYTLNAVNEPFMGRLPDFNMAFYVKEGGQLKFVDSDNDVGDQSGTFPPGSGLYVGVYMAYPDRPVTSKFHVTLECLEQ